MSFQVGFNFERSLNEPVEHMSCLTTLDDCSIVCSSAATVCKWTAESVNQTMCQLLIGEVQPQSLALVHKSQCCMNEDSETEGISALRKFEAGIVAGSAPACSWSNG